MKGALDYVRAGDKLVVWKLDRLARSMKQLIDTVDQIEGARDRLPLSTAQSSGLKAALARGRKGGRSQRIKPDDIRAALALLADPEISVRAAAAKLGVSVSALYRNAPALRSRVGESR